MVDGSKDGPIARADARAAEWARTHKRGYGPLGMQWDTFAGFVVAAVMFGILGIVALFRFLF